VAFCTLNRSNSLVRTSSRTRAVRSSLARVCGAVLLVSLSALAATAAEASTNRHDRVACGVELWSLKTLSDPQKALVRLRPISTTVAAINARPKPNPTPTTRNTLYERRVWRVRAQIVEFKLEADDDIHLVLFERGSYMIAEMPSASCLVGTRDRRAIVAARNLFIRRCGAPSESWQSLGAVAYISGVGFWDFPHGQTGAARNYAELHPVTGLRVVSGCGASG
jgi:hypothetical protein